MVLGDLGLTDFRVSKGSYMGPDDGPLPPLKRSEVSRRVEQGIQGVCK